MELKHETLFEFETLFECKKDYLHSIYSLLIVKAIERKKLFYVFYNCKISKVVKSYGGNWIST